MSNPLHKADRLNALKWEVAMHFKDRSRAEINALCAAISEDSLKATTNAYLLGAGDLDSFIIEDAVEEIAAGYRGDLIFRSATADNANAGEASAAKAESDANVEKAKLAGMTRAQRMNHSRGIASK